MKISRRKTGATEASFLGTCQRHLCEVAWWSVYFLEMNVEAEFEEINQTKYTGGG